MPSRSLQKNNCQKLQSLKCFELIFTVAESQRLQRGKEFVTDSSRPQSSCDPFAVIIRQIWINVSQISPTFFRRAFIENNSWISSDRESQRYYKVKVGAFNYTYYKPSTFKDNHLV